MEAKNLLKDSTLVYISVYILIFFKFAAGFLIANILGPSLYGLRSLFGLVIEYEQFSHLGTFDAMRREVPYARGRNDAETAGRIVDNVFTVNFFYALIVCGLMILAAVYLHRANYERIYIDFVLFMGPYSLTEKINNFYVSKLIVDKRAQVLGRVRILQGFSYALFAVLLTYLYGMRGLFIGLLASSVTVCIFVFHAAGEPPKIRFSPRTVSGLLKIGFPIMVIVLMFIVMRSVDRIIIASMLSQEMLGYFAVGTIVSGFIYTGIGDMVGAVFGPRVMEKLGETGDIRQIRHFLIEPTVVLSYFTPLLAGPIFLALPDLIRFLLPAYIRATGVVQTLVLSALFVSIATVPMMVCVAMNRQNRVVLLMLISILANAFSSYLFIRFGWGIDGVAVGTGFSYFLFSFAALGYSLKQFKATPGEYVRFFALVFFPAFYCIGLVFLTDNLPVHPILKFFLFFSAYSLVFLFVKRHSGFKKLIGSVPFFRSKAQPIR